MIFQLLKLNHDCSSFVLNTAIDCLILGFKQIFITHLFWPMLLIKKINGGGGVVAKSCLTL